MKRRKQQAKASYVVMALNMHKVVILWQKKNKAQKSPQKYINKYTRLTSSQGLPEYKKIQGYRPAGQMV